MRHTILRYLLLAGAAATVLSGCGGEGRLSKQQYEQRVQAVYTGVQEAFRATDVKLAPRLAAAERELRRAADKLLALEPPQEVVSQNATIAVGFRRYADDIAALRKALAAGDESALDRFNEALRTNEAIEEISEAAEQLKFSGYDLGDLSKD